MADLSLVAGDGFSIDCHRVMVTTLGPYLASLLEDSRPTDQIIFPDFCVDDMCCLLHLLYTGE